MAILAMLALAPQAAGAAEPDGVLLCGPGVAPLPIVTQAANQKQAESLARYLGQISGQKFSVKVATAAPAEAAIIVGAFGDPVAKAFTGDGFLIRAEPATRRLWLAGRTTLANGFAVYAMLADDLGCRWWSHNEEEVPKLATLQLDAGERRYPAYYRFIDLRNNEAQTTKNDFHLKARSVSTEDWTQGHAIYRLMAPYGATHPEIYPYSRKTQKRAPNKLHLCYSAPGLPEALAAAIEREIAARKGQVQDVVYMADMGDWYGGTCECEACLAIYAEEAWVLPSGKPQAAPIGTLIRLLNQTVEVLLPKYPGIQVGTQAYMTLEGPPGKTVPRPEIRIRIPHLRHCIQHGIAECPNNAGYYRNLRRWCELAPGRVTIWDYTVNFGDNFLYPFPVIRSIGANLKTAHTLGVSGMTLQGNYVSTGGDLAVLKNFVWRKLLWQPELVIEALVTEFCQGYYGPAAAPMLQYVNTLEDAAAGPDSHWDEFAKAHNWRQSVLAADRTKQLRAALAEAKTLAGTQEPFARRVLEAEVSLEAMALGSFAGKLVEHEGRLCRETAQGPQYTYDRAASMLAHSRQASFREWDAWRSYHQPFLVAQGGPLHELTQGALKVQVAPAQGMKLRQIWWREQPLLCLPREPAKKGAWELLGGCREEASPGWRLGTVQGPPSATELKLATTHESGSSEKFYSRKTVSLPGGERLLMSVSAKSARVQEGFRGASAKAICEYRVDARGAAIWALLADGTWQPVMPAFPGDPTPGAGALPAGSKALRVALPLAGCLVEETLLAPGVELASGLLELDAKRGYLRTTLQSTRVTVGDKAWVDWLARELRLSDLPADLVIPPPPKPVAAAPPPAKPKPAPAPAGPPAENPDPPVPPADDDGV